MLRASSNLTSVLYAKQHKMPEKQINTFPTKRTSHLAPARIFLRKCVCKYLQLENVCDLSVYSRFVFFPSAIRIKMVAVLYL